MKPKTKRDTLVGQKEIEGLDLPEYEIITESLLSAWVMRIKDGVKEDWMNFQSFYLEKSEALSFFIVITI